MSATFDITKRTGRVEVCLRSCYIGKDLQVTITGGDRPHIGAVALSCRHPALKDSNRDDVSTSVLAVAGHKEDLLARNAAQRIAAATGLTTAVCCGIHVEQISKAEILSVTALVEQLVDELIDRIRTGP